METRANHVLIGAFALIVILLGFGFVTWLGQVKLTKQVKTYDVIFDGSVSGLGVGGAVRYNGINIGQVTQMALKPDDPSKVRVRIEVDANAPVTADTVATLEYMGVTGVSYVNLAGGTAKSLPLEAKPGQDVPVIASKPSGLQDLFAGAPSLIAGGDEFVKKLNLMLDETNRQRISNILANTERMTANFERSSGKIDSLISNLDQAATNLNAMSADLRALAANTNRVVEVDVPQLMTDARQMTASAAEAAAQLEGIASENRAAIADFTHNGLGQFTRFATEARALVHSLDRVANRLDSDPQSIIYGPGAAEIDLK